MNCDLNKGDKGNDSKIFDCAIVPVSISGECDMQRTGVAAEVDATDF